MAGRLHKPKAKSFWILVRRLLCRKNRKANPAAAEEEKSGLLSRSSLEELLMTDAAQEDAAKKHGQAPVEATGGWPGLHLHRPVTARSQVACGGRDGAAMHRRFMFGGFRRRLLMRRPWRPVLVAIPE
ncbi:hypothetical protein PR202_gb26528 [Eleusine coracana subsp. coracana]|uniref:Uncharacterized protein n=1 Tax=Eleusine coracana subsp. coracana TaxID=191504 RepID=A0AAV5FSD9_ELECO|nr:hypothetical protein QOZ80_1BG0057480 [Eleusine coracana subsp. coracana]GJN37557.1 hypothetical protein PR202_gb26528 [Eleusine coracana subsp. coracana]